MIKKINNKIKEIIYFYKKKNLYNNLKYKNKKNIKDLLKKETIYPPVNFLITSDTHFYDTSLGTKSEIFQNYMKSDRKILEKSPEITSSLINDIIKISPEFVIIPGDLSKDGEKVSHKKFANKLKILKDNNIQPYIINGNHDIKNGDAVKYMKNQTKSVDTVTADEFKNIYKEFGYNQAIFNDDNSLSYVVEPKNNLWLLAIDSCRWRENKLNNHPITAGKIYPKTLKWIENILIKAKEKNKTVIVFMHHGIWEHFNTNKKYYGEYIVEDNEILADLFASYGINLVFTGHFHAQDVAYKKWNNNKFLLDIETGSLITYPCPYRKINITGNQILDVRTKRIEKIESVDKNFKHYTKEFVYNASLNMIKEILKQYHLLKKDIEILAPQITKLFMSHLKGDETKNNLTISTEKLSILGKIIVFFNRKLLNAWKSDLPPGDNFFKINLKNGNIIEKDDDIINM